MRPLADEIRPQTLDDVAGQKHLLGEGALLRRLIENGTDANLIFYGPSGTGKTTVANIIARQAKKGAVHPKRHHRIPPGCEECHGGCGHHDGSKRYPAVPG